MSSSSLAERLRGIVRASIPASAVAAGCGDSTSPTPLQSHLGGSWCEFGDSRCFVVERRFEAAAECGRMTVGAIAAQLAEYTEELQLLASGAAARPPFVFFDLETTGLSGGAGTYAFLVGCARVESDGLTVRQFLLSRPSDEPAMLRAIGAEFEGAGALVSFNGRTFDAPLLEMRHLYHRLPSVIGALPHVDVLHPARRFWRDTGTGALAETGCSLATLERQVLGTRRSDDVPGVDIPSRYFQFLRTGNAAPLGAVLEHNRSDLVSLAGLMVSLLRLVRSGPGAARHAREAFALGEVYERAGLDARAREAFACAVGLDGRSLPGGQAVRPDALRALALSWRRARQYDRAAGCWARLLDCGCPPRLAREATEALAIHHEHRLRDLDTARVFALQSLEAGAGTAWTEAVQRRLNRLDRKKLTSAARAALDLG